MDGRTEGWMDGRMDRILRVPVEIPKLQLPDLSLPSLTVEGLGSRAAFQPTDTHCFYPKMQILHALSGTSDPQTGARKMAQKPKALSSMHGPSCWC